MSRLRPALTAIAFARNYTRELLDTIPEADWFRMPDGGTTHVAWQVGHLAMSEYRLCMERLRGPQPDDEALIPAALLKAFGRTSVVDPHPAAYPSASEIRALLDRVHDRLLAELPAFPEADWDTPITVTHRFCKTKGECIRWCSAHEMLHAGQIGLLRRLFGARPIW